MRLRGPRALRGRRRGRRRARGPRSAAAASSARGSSSSCRRRSGRAGRTPRPARPRRRRRATASTSPKRTTRPSTSTAGCRSPLPLTRCELLAPRAERSRRLGGEPDELDALLGIERSEHVGGRTRAGGGLRRPRAARPRRRERDDASRGGRRRALRASRAPIASSRSASRVAVVSSTAMPAARSPIRSPPRSARSSSARSFVGVSARRLAAERGEQPAAGEDGAQLAPAARELGGESGVAHIPAQYRLLLAQYLRK